MFVTITCGECGKVFTYNQRGKVRRYCSTECSKKAHSKQIKACIKRARDKKKAKRIFKRVYSTPEQKYYDEKIEQISKVNETCQQQDGNIIFSKDRVIVVNSKEVSDLLGLLRNLGASLFSLREFQRKLSTEQSKYDKADQEFLHKLESMSTITDTEAIQMVQDVAKARVERRDVKTLIEICLKILNCLPENPEKIARDIINNKLTADEYFAKLYSRKENANESL